MAATKELTGAAKAAVEKKSAKVEVELPEGRLLGGGSTAGRWPDAGTKDIVVATPICPKSQIRGTIENGRFIPPDIGPDDINCQAGEIRQWWKECEAKGHDPYFRTISRITFKTTYTVDEEGDKIPHRKEVLREDRILNVTSVSTSKRIGSGRALAWKKRYYGFRDISEFGFPEVCHLSRCERPVKIVIAKLGAFCSQEHVEISAFEETSEDHEVMPKSQQKYALGEEDKLSRKRKQIIKRAYRDSEYVEEN
jgi:hypothetical protein